MLKIMYQEDSNKEPVCCRRGFFLYQAWKYMDNEYFENRHNVAMGECSGLIVDLLPAETLTRFLHGHTNAPQSEFFPGYVIVGIKSRYCGIWDCWFIELA